MIRMASGAGWCNVAKIRFPLPPSSNKYWRYDRGKVHVSPDALNYRYTVKMLARCSTPRPVVLTGPVAVTIDVFRARKSGDIDNFCKVLLDALQGIFYVNDAQIRRMTVTMADDKQDPHVEIAVTSLRENAE